MSDGGQVSGTERMDFYTGSGNDTATFTNISAEGEYWRAGGGTNRAIIDYSGFSQSVSFPAGSSAITQLADGTHAVSMQYVYEFDITGGAGNDSFNGYPASWVSFHGGSGNDTLYGSSGNDLLFGGSGNDTISDYGGNGRLYGGSGRDVIDGGEGNDRIDGGTGNDILTGGNGSDRFVFLAGFGHDRITDFVAGSAPGDVLDFSALHLFLSNLSLTSASGGASTLVTVITTGDSVLLSGTAFSSFNAASDLFF